MILVLSLEYCVVLWHVGRVGKSYFFVVVFVGPQSSLKVNAIYIIILPKNHQLEIVVKYQTHCVFWSGIWYGTYLHSNFYCALTRIFTRTNKNETMENHRKGRREYPYIKKVR